VVFTKNEFYEKMTKSTAHVAIVGGTMSGKSTLAKELAWQYGRTSGINSIVLDKWGSRDWSRYSTVFTQKDAWLQAVWAARGCAVWMDEGTTELDRNDKAMVELFTGIRHLGHKFHFICHRWDAMSPVMREQISTCYIFKRNKREAKFFAEWLGYEEIEHMAPKLNQFEFLEGHLFTPPVVKKLTF
jgi:energy-coupling factor transporter ATP-binding protein EcfA2